MYSLYIGFSIFFEPRIKTVRGGPWESETPVSVGILDATKRTRSKNPSVMFNSSNLILKAMNSFPKKKKRKQRKKILVGKKQTRFYYGDRDFYRNIYLKSEHWINLKKEKLKEFDCCALCNSIKKLDVHHLNYKNLYDVELSDLLVVCRPCHAKIHKKI